MDLVFANMTQNNNSTLWFATQASLCDKPLNGYNRTKTLTTLMNQRKSRIAWHFQSLVTGEYWSKCPTPKRSCIRTDLPQVHCE